MEVRTEAGTGTKQEESCLLACSQAQTPFLCKTGSLPDVLLPHSGQGPPISIISQENAPTDLPTCQFVGDISPIAILSSQTTLACVKLTNNTKHNQIG